MENTVTISLKDYLELCKFKEDTEKDYVYCRLQVLVELSRHCERWETWDVPILKKELNNTLIKSHEKLSSDYETLESKLKDSNKKIELLNEKNARLKSLSNMSAWQFIKWKLKNKS